MLILSCNVLRIYTIGKDALMSWDVQIMDSDMHYMMEGNTIKRNSKRIVIGENAWISNRVSVLKGTELPANIIVASNSLLSKDFLIYLRIRFWQGLRLISLKRMYGGYEMWKTREN